jgi:hypothetical protein
VRAHSPRSYTGSVEIGRSQAKPERYQSRRNRKTTPGPEGRSSSGIQLTSLELDYILVLSALVPARSLIGELSFSSGLACMSQPKKAIGE